MAVRAKFRCMQNDKDALGFHASVRMIPVGMGPGSENEKFWKATPSGELQMHITNPGAFEQFEVGKSYYLDITEAPE
jgi:hypothetical protein